MTKTLEAKIWERLLEECSPPSRGELEKVLADTDVVDVGDPAGVVATAIHEGVLVEDIDAGMFGEISVNYEQNTGIQPGSEDDTDPDQDTLENADNRQVEGGFPRSNPGGNVDVSTPSAPEFTELDFSATEGGTYPPALLEREQWMGAKGKLPFAPWGDPNAPAECNTADCPADRADHPDCGCDARWKWGYTGHYIDGNTLDEHADTYRELDGRVFLQQETDPFAFVDGDDVRDPDTGDVHPEFRRILDTLGLTYTDVSTSGAGVHAYYEGELPNGQGQAVFEIDTEPWGSNDTPPTVEIYANTHVCVATGDYVEGAPDDVRPWDPDALEDVLEEYDAVKDPDPIDHDTDQDLELEDHTPEATEREESTTDARDIALAVDRLRPADLPLEARQVGTDATGWEKWDPSSYRTSSGNDSLHRPPGEPVFHDHKHGESFGVLSLFAAEQGILSKPWDRLAGGDWWDAVDAAREAGAPIPEYEGERSGEDTEHTAVLPPAVRELSTATTGWDWRNADRPGDTLTLQDARDRTTDAIAAAYERHDQVLVEALPTMGKSYGAVKAAAETGESVTILTPRGRNEQYQRFKDWAEEFGLDLYQLPAFTHDCDTANGEHGEDWKETVRDWYRRGATPKEIHKAAEYVLGEPLPCQQHEGARCPYTSKWDFDPDEFDVLLGHYTHAHKSKVTTGRTVVFDEFPDAYEEALAVSQGGVSYWLSTADGVPFDDYTDLLEHRDDDERREEALDWFDEHGVEPDETHVFDDPKARADTPLAVYTLLAGEDLGNGFEKADLEGVGVGVYNRESAEVSVLRPPDLEYTSGIVGLDGTPTKRMWQLALGERLNHRPVLQDDERAEYIRDALNLNLVRSSEYVKSYNSKDHVNVERDGALLEAITEEHGKKPALITTKTAKGVYDEAGVLELVDGTKHYGDVLGSNEFDDVRLGAVIGSNHYGDGYIQKWGAYAGEAVERTGGKGKDLSYGSFGDDVLQHMREHDTLQAAMRFGRDGNGAVVYVHTDTLPDWVPIAGEARVVSTWSEGMKDVLEALEHLGSATTREIAEYATVDIGRRQVYEHLQALRERGVLRRERDENDGRRLVWWDSGVDSMSEYGDVDLEAGEFDAPELEALEVAEPGRMDYIYTWEFLNPTATHRRGELQPGESTADAVDEATSGGDPPPDPGD